MKTRTTSLCPVPRPRFRAINLLTCTALLAAQLTLLPNSAHADVTVTGAEVGGNVVFSYSGSVDLTGLTSFGDGSSQPTIKPDFGFIAGSQPSSSYDVYAFSPSAVTFGAGSQTNANSGTGDVFAVVLGAGELGCQLDTHPIHHSRDPSLSTGPP
jgi:hypothetical protein